MGLIPSRLARVRQGALRALAFVALSAGVAGHTHADGSGNADIVTGIGCMQDEAGFSLNCTANDISLANANNIVILDDGCNAIGDTVTFTADFEVLLTAQNRHDIGIWFAEDGDPNGDGAISGACTAASPPFGPAPAWTDIDTPLGEADQCGDITSANNPLFPNIELTVTCIDPDGDGKLNLPNCTSWRQPGVNDICNSAAEAFPGAPSKCKCDDGFTVDIDVPPPVYTIAKVVVDGNGDPLPGDTTSFEFAFTPSGAGGAVPGLHTLMDGASESGELQVGSYAVTETISDPAYELDNWACTINGLNGLKIVSSGSQTLNVTIEEGDGTLDCIVTNKLLFVEAPGIAIAKTPDTQNVVSGQTAVFDIAVSTGESNVPISSVVVTDAQCTTGPIFTGGDTNGDNILDLDETWTYTCEVANVTADFTNTASVTGKSPADADVSAEDTAAVTVLTPGLEVVKSFTGITGGDGDADAELGETLNYTITATNSGDTALTNVVVSDDLTGQSNTCASVAVGSTCVLNASYVVTLDDVAAGTVNNIGTADSNETDPVDDPEEVPVVANPSLIVDKAFTGITGGDGDADAELGETLNYTITATNSGDIALTNVVVSDSLTGQSTSCASVAVGGTCILSATYVVTLDDVAAGMVNNIGTADSNETDPVDDPEEVPVVANPSLIVDKAFTGITGGDGDADAELGETLNYTITATNNGDIALTNVVVSDDLTGQSNTCASVAVGSTCVLNASYVVTLDDVAAGMVNNIGTADSNETGPVDDPEEVPVVANPSLIVDKAFTGITGGDGDADAELGETLSYTITATNNGDIALTNVVVSDDLTGQSNTCASVAVGSTCVLNASYVVTLDDVAAGMVNNVGTADSDETDPVDDPEEVPVVANPSLIVDKAFTGITGGDGDADAELGETLNYTITATNNGDIALTNVVVSDDLTGQSNTCASVAVGSTCVLNASYVVTLDDVAAGMVNNVGTADSDETDPVDDPEEVPVVSNPAYEIEKVLDGNNDADGNGVVSLNDTLTYTVTVTNTGDVAMDITVSDSLISPSSNTCTAVPPVVGTCGLTGTYQVDQNDVDAGMILNVATGMSNLLPDITADLDIAVPQIIDLSINKLTNGADDNILLEGSPVNWTYQVTNTGNTTLDNLSVTDSDPGVSVVCPVGTLAPGASTTCSASGIAIAGDYTNTGTADADGPQDQPAMDSDNSGYFGANPGVSINKVTNGVDDLLILAGADVTWTYEVTNTGNVDLATIVVTDDPQGAVCTVNDLAAGATATCTLMGTAVTGDYSNTGTASSGYTDSTGNTESVSATDPSNYFGADPGIGIDKAGTLVTDVVGDPGIANVGDRIDYTFTVTNTGNIYLDNVNVTDPLSGLSAISCNGTTTGGIAFAGNGTGTLQAGDSVVCSASYTLTQPDIDAGEKANTASAAGDPPVGPDVDDTDPELVDIPQFPSHEFVKSFNPDTVEIGEDGTFTLVYTNTGNVTLSDVMIDDLVDPILDVNTVTISDGSCAAASQTVDCTVDSIAPDDSVVVSVGFTAAAGAEDPAGQTSGASYVFYFENGYILEGRTDTNYAKLTAPDGTVTDPYTGVSGANQDIVFNTPDGQSFQMHLSCSEPFVNGYGITGPTEADNPNWKILSYDVNRYNSQGFLKSCSQAFGPFPVDNTASAEATPAGGDLTPNPITASDSVELIQKSPITVSRKRVRRGNVEIQYFNTSQEAVEISIIGVTWNDGAVLQSASYQDGVDLGLNGSSPQSAAISTVLGARSKDWLRLDFEPNGVPDGLTVTIVLVTGETLTYVY